MLRKLSIQTRLMLAFGVIALLVTAMGTAGWYIARMQNGSFNRFNKHVVGSVMAYDKARVAMLESHALERAILIRASDAAATAEYLKKWDEQQQVADKAIAAFKAVILDPKTLVDANAAESGFAAYRQNARPVLEKIIAGQLASPADADAALKPAVEQLQSGVAALARVDSTVSYYTDVAMTKLNGFLSFITTAAFVLIALSVGLVALLAWRISRSIVQPMNDAARFAEQVGAGDLTATLDVQGQDEATRLQRSLAQMRDALQSMVSRVRDVTEGITTASSEIAHGNQDLSQRTEQTASNLQQTASSMEQLTGTVKQSADAARQANQLASSASTVASRGGEVVSQVVSTMDEISAASKKIADIIGVIDGIAFQTNILALNAAVEAARAGEQGRGFAVVAGEVRNLAQRSAQAAKEIKSLIGASVEKVDSGARLVQDAGSTMTEIVASVQRVTDIIGEITAATSEQSTGIGQVNTAVNQLDQMTQQNAALVEESAAAAESLRQQAERLSEVVAAFKLADAQRLGSVAMARAHETALVRSAPVVRSAPAAPAVKPAPAAVKAPAPAPAKLAPVGATVTTAAAPKPVAAPAHDDDWATF
ncbi:methyl-accepting chemotaxis protein [Caldimonas brevitalea]|uniref:Methyl-accepting chemotaxis protein n=1 Tax=Caldimonas brevitalea TaxID=413882 RepID=A0A0G3BNK8_9BURK|nr:methyl-accepting chemotaxis protein [Caldimonas brevitalea]AKJ31034.1 methyl-accepting chemotaxis protein [Caldimonas brevitalea]